MTDTLQWHSLHGWEPTEGTWAILWPGHYGPFTACWINGRWTMCEDIDFNNATVGVEEICRIWQQMPCRAWFNLDIPSLKKSVRIAPK